VKHATKTESKYPLTFWEIVIDQIWRLAGCHSVHKNLLWSYISHWLTAI